MQEFCTWLEALAPKVLPESRLGKAVHCALGQWSKLCVFLTHGDVPRQNNRCENAIRPFVVGRKGWLFSDTVELQRTVGAILFSEELTDPIATAAARAQYIRAHPEQPLLALVTTECNAWLQDLTQRKVEKESDKYVMMASVNLVNCIAHSDARRATRAPESIFSLKG